MKLVLILNYVAVVASGTWLILLTEKVEMCELNIAIAFLIISLASLMWEGGCSKCSESNRKENKK